MLASLIEQLLEILLNQGIIADYAIFPSGKLRVDVAVQKMKGTSFIYIPIKLGRKISRFRYKK